MIEPSHQQLVVLKKLLKNAIANLCSQDSELYSSVNIDSDIFYSDIYKTIDRKLHEVTINHRLAHHIENLLENYELNGYFVDIEYNRFYQNEKLLQTSEGTVVVRPDIVVHARRNQQHSLQHYLIIEAKKGKLTEYDINKVTSFIKDPHYCYMFGATISYASHQKALCNIYYTKNSAICCECI